MTLHRQIFRSCAIIGSASVLRVILGIIQMKAIAIMLGPLGVGLIGLYQNILGVASTVAGCGLESSGVRQLAASQEDANTMDLVRKALFYANFLLGIAGMVLLWLLRESVAQWVFGNLEHVVQVGYLGIGVLFTLLAGSQTALLQGMRRISDLGRVQVISSLSAAIIGIAIIWLWGANGMIAFILVGPATSVLAATWYVRRLPRLIAGYDWEKLRKQWHVMFSLGIPLMAAALLTLITQLIARTLVVKNLGLEANGFYQAAWVICMTYLGFVLNSMAVDYFPRLSSMVHDREQAVKLVNEQTEMGLLLAGPVLLTMMTLIPWVIELLFTKNFAPAAEILRWQVMGDIIKVMIWPMGFVVLAQGRGVIYIATQLNWNVAYLLFVWFALPKLGLESMGIAFFIAYLAQIAVEWSLASRLIGFIPKISNIIFFIVILLSLSVIHVYTHISTQWSYIVGALLTISITSYSFYRLNILLNLTNLIKRKL